MVENSEVKLWGQQTNGPQQLRQHWKNQYVGRRCMYGEHSHGLWALLTLCDGCKRDMEVYIEEFLVKWGY